jgi:hypothetical protein
MMAVLLLSLIAIGATPQGETLRVRTTAELRQAVSKAKPGTSVLLEPGEYSGGIHLSNLHGSPGKTIVFGAADPSKPPRIVGGGSGLQLSDVSHLEVRDLVIERATGNGVNIDDGGSYETPSHHVTLKNLRVTDLPKGNNDGIKLSGLDDFRVENCVVERWGGSGIDMVGCHRGKIVGCTFRSGGDSGVQCKGGTSDVSVSRSRFENFGQRGVNIGGSTGLPFFRPSLDKVPVGSRYEAKGIRVEGCTFIGGISPIAFVGVDGAVVRFNTIYHPERWAIRILQETRTPDFVPSRNGVFEDNLVVFRSDAWVSGGVNIGADTAPATFKFARNFWFCSDRPENSRPRLPSAEVNGSAGQDPMLRDPAKGDLAVRDGSPARNVGAHAYKL